MDCPHCGHAVLRKGSRGDKLKARTSMLVLHKSGDVEVNCPHCRRGVLLPLSFADSLFKGGFTLRKAYAPRLIVRKA
jgi:DNA-directed RNA polymerase subunit RPC12/RpoP